VVANGCLRKEARRKHLDYINKGLLSTKIAAKSHATIGPQAPKAPKGML